MVLDWTFDAREMARAHRTDMASAKKAGAAGRELISQFDVTAAKLKTIAEELMADMGQRAAEAAARGVASNTTQVSNATSNASNATLNASNTAGSNASLL